MYKILRQLAFLRDAERAHESALRVLERFSSAFAGRAFLRLLAGPRPSHAVAQLGLRFAHPVGLAAGFDKDARAVLAWQAFGFSFVEIGTVTPRPQPGNPRPRLWRFPEAEALVNALGFPGEGMERVAARLRALRQRNLVRIPLGINVGKNADTPVEEAESDYAQVLRHLFPYGDYFVINISSPNTPGLRDLQTVERLRPLLASLQELNAWLGRKPLLVKIAPDLADEDIAAIGALARELMLAGIVAGNTTVRRDLVPRAAALTQGGLSGAPLFARTCQMLKILRPLLAPGQVLVAAGGISSAARLREALQLGADLVQVYTPFVYLGPRCVRHLLRPS